MRDYPRLSWLNAKTAPQATGGRKNRSGQLNEHVEAIQADLDWTVKASQSFAAAVDKALAERAAERAVALVDFVARGSLDRELATNTTQSVDCLNGDPTANS